jgi:uncharacterized protein (TIGR03118 family)
MAKAFCRMRRSALVFALGSVTLLASALPAAGGNWFYTQTNLVSDVPGLAPVTDANLANPWGLAHNTTSPFWVSNNGSGTSTLYTGAGQPFPIGNPLIVTIPPAPGNEQGVPTGVVAHTGSGFVVGDGGGSGPAAFIFATEDGTIAAWSGALGDRSKAVQVADQSESGAVYKGLALGTSSAGDVLYATNFSAGTIDVFDSSFQLIQLDGPFVDKHAAGGYGPFGIANIGGQIFVTYAQQDAARHDDVPGVGKGFVDVFDTDGHFVRRFAQSGRLNAPWGLVLAPSDFGQFSNALLVGNFGDGHLLGFDPATGKFLGQLSDKRGQPLAIDGLWGLSFGNGALAGPTNRLFFAAGIQDESHGLFGSLQACPIRGDCL